MQPKGFSKATGIEFLCKYFKIPLENCYAVGDSKNDLQMLSYVPHSIVMGESQKELFEIAEFITDTVLNDGIQKALMHYHLI